MRSDYGMGYLFGLGATYIDMTGIERDSTNAHDAFLGLNSLTFGEADGRQIFREQIASSSLSSKFNLGASAAQSDFVDVLKSYSNPEHVLASSLVVTMLSLTSEG